MNNKDDAGKYSPECPHTPPKICESWTQSQCERPYAHRTDPHLQNTIIYSQRKISNLLNSLKYYKKNKMDAQEELEHREREASKNPTEPGWYWCTNDQPHWWDGVRWGGMVVQDLKATIGPDGLPLRIINPSEYK